VAPLDDVVDFREFASVRRPFAWKKGTYTWSIAKAETIQRKGKPATWFNCRVKEHDTAKAVDVGSLFEGNDFTLRGGHSAFVEVYSTEKIPNSNIPKVHVAFGWPRVNGDKVKLKKTSAYYPDPAKGDLGSPDCATARADGDRCVVEGGPIFRRDETKRRHDLDIK
jgi:hypothetical protein